MIIDEAVYAALVAVLPNAHRSELPEVPTWPAIVFEIDTNEEPGWVMGGGYDMHDIVVTTLARGQAGLIALRKPVSATIAALPGFMGTEFSGDADYQGEAGVYAYVQNFRVRTRR